MFSGTGVVGTGNGIAPDIIFSVMHAVAVFVGVWLFFRLKHQKYRRGFVLIALGELLYILAHAQVLQETFAHVTDTILLIAALCYFARK